MNRIVIAYVTFLLLWGLPVGAKLKTPTVINYGHLAHVYMDDRSNVLLVRSMSSFALPPKEPLNPLQSPIIDACAAGYSACDRTGFGGFIKNVTFLESVNINGVNGDGLIVATSGSSISRGVIANVSGTGIVIKGSNNSISNIVFFNCRQLVQFSGSNNIVYCDVFDGVPTPAIYSPRRALPLGTDSPDGIPRSSVQGQILPWAH